MSCCRKTSSASDQRPRQALPKIPSPIPNGVPRYILDLDLPPMERYRHIINDFKDHFAAVNDFVDAMAKDVAPSAGAFVLKCVQGVLNLSNKLSVVYYSEELAAIAELSGMPLGRIVMMQLIYEASALCTSVAVPMNSEGKVGHIRTMDWEMDFLKHLTLEVEVRQNGRTHAIATTWAGYCGFLTGVAVRPRQDRDGFSVSVNFRSVGSGTFSTNLKCALTRAWPIGFLVRETLMQADGYPTAVSWLTNSRLIAPCYFTVCGAQPWKGALVTRCRDTSARPLFLKDPNAVLAVVTSVDDDNAQSVKKSGSKRPNGRKQQNTNALSPNNATSPLLTCAECLVQPNMDHWRDDDDGDILWSRRRRSDGRALMTQLMAAYGALGEQHEGYDASLARPTKGTATTTTASAASATPSSDSLGSTASSPPTPTIGTIPQSALWAAMSCRFILNDITIYGTYMDPRLGTLETRIPIGERGTARRF